MSNKQATAGLIVGFVACLLVGSWLLWLAWILYLVYVLARPEANGGKKAERSTLLLSSAEHQGHAQPLSARESDYLALLRHELACATDESDRRGLKRALEMAEHLWLVNTSTVEASVSVPATPQHIKHPWISLEVRRDNVGDAIRRMRTHTDQTVALLYVGAFLLIAAAGLFLAYSLADAGLKFGLLAVGCILFYGAGLYLLQLRSQLRPAAVAFVGIGLLLLPICGVAAHALLAIDTSTSWLLTSLLGVAMYVYAAVKLQSGAIAYLSVLSWLSLVLSGVSVANAPLYLYVWLVIIVGMILHVVRPSLRGSLLVTAEPAAQSAQLLVPLSALVGLVLVSNQLPLWQAGVSLILAGIYYGLVARESKGSSKSNFAMVAHMAVLIGVAVICYDGLNDTHLFGLLLLMLGLAHVAWFGYLERKTIAYWASSYCSAVYIIASVLSLVALLFVADDTVLLSAMLAVSAGAHAALYWARKSQQYGLVVTALLLCVLPFVLSVAISSEANVRTNVVIITSFLVALKAFYFRHMLRKDSAVVRVARGVLALMLSVTWLLSLTSPTWWILASTQLALLLLVEYIGRYERWPILSVFGPSFVWAASLAIFSMPHIAFNAAQALLGGMLMASVYSYIYALCNSDRARRRISLLWTFVLGIGAWFIASTSILPAYTAPIILITFAVIGMYELVRRNLLLELRTLPVAATVLALEQVVVAYGMPLGTPTHMLIWALFSLGSAVWLEGFRRRASARLYAYTSAGLLALACGTIGVAALLVADGSTALLLATVHPDSVLLIVAALAGMAYLMRRQASLPETVGGYRAVYVSALAGGVVVALSQSSHLLAIAVLLTAATASLALSFKDKTPVASAAVPPLLALAAFRWLELLAGAQGSAESYVAISLAVGAVLGYAVMRVVQADYLRAQAMLGTSITLALLAWLLDWSSVSGVLPPAFGPVLLAAAAGSLLIEARRIHLSTLLALLPIALLNIAFQQLLGRLMPEASWLIYTHLWALYLVFVTWRLRQQGYNLAANRLKFAVLVVFSAPLAYQALLEPDMYATILLGEHAALLVLGVFLRRTYMVYWATIVSILAVMYMLRSFAYVQLGIIAVVLIGYGVYRLMRGEAKH